MTEARPIATSFNGGELSSRMGGRVDVSVYAVGVELMENFVPTVEGAAVKRPGFEYIREAAPTAAWLSTFRFNIAQDYLIEWSDGKLRFFTNGARVETAPGVAYEVAVPYTAAQAPHVSCQQSFDVLYMTHPAHRPARLRRTSATTFVHEYLDLKNGPFADANSDEANTLTASGVEGNGITLTASTPVFAAGHVGSLLRIEAKDFSTIKAWEAGLDGVTIGQVRRSEGKAYTAETAGRTGTVQPTHTQGAEWDGSGVGKDINSKPEGASVFGIRWAYRHDRWGIARITAVADDGTSATADVVRRLPDSLTSVATHRWAHALFSAARGWPNVVKVWAGRLVFFKDFDIVGSVAGDYPNFLSTTTTLLIPGDLAFRRTIATEDRVLWAAGDRKLIAGTASCELAIGAINAAAAVAGDNIGVEPQSFYGSERVWPLQAGTSTFFVQRGGTKLREAQYDFARDRYTAANLTVWARHMARGGIRQLAFQKEPEELLIGVRGDGQFIVHPHQPEQEIKGFARMVLGGGGKALSATCIGNADGSRDELWALVERAGVKSIERMAAWHEDGDAIERSFFVDGGVQADAAAGQTRFTGLTHLAGRAVAVLAGGGVVPGATVTGDGVLNLSASSVPGTPYVLAVGLPYAATLTTLRPELRTNDGTAQGKRKRIVKFVLRLLETAGIRVGAKGGDLDPLIDRPGSARMDEPVPLFSGDKDGGSAGDWDLDGQATFVSDEPLPCIIVAAMPKMVVTS